VPYVLFSTINSLQRDTMLSYITDSHVNSMVAYDQMIAIILIALFALLCHVLPHLGLIQQLANDWLSKKTPI